MKWGKYFDTDEFVCKCGCKAFAKRDELVEKLDRVREMVKMPIMVNSGTRCNAHNREVGGVDTSDHLDGLAADIRCDDMYMLLRACMKVFKRVGIGPQMSFVHVDIADTAKGREGNKYWTYGNNNKRIT